MTNRAGRRQRRRHPVTLKIDRDKVRIVVAGLDVTNTVDKLVCGDPANYQIVLTGSYREASDDADPSQTN